MSFLLRWLGLTIDRPEGLSVRPARTLEVALPFEEAFERCMSGLRDGVGANISACDQEAGTIEAAFGLINSERIACMVRRGGATTSVITIESRRIAGSGLSKSSAVLERLSEWIRDGR